MKATDDSHSLVSYTANHFKVMRAARAPLLVAVVAAVFLAYAPQSQELYRALAENPTGNVLQLLLSLVILCGTSLALALIARQLLRESTVPRRPRLWRRSLPILCGMLAPAGLSAGLWLAASDTLIGSPPQMTLDKIPELGLLLHALDVSRANLIAAGAICTLLAVSLMVPRVGFRSPRVLRIVARRRIRISHMISLGLATLALFSLVPVSGAQFFGSISVFLLATIGIAAMMAVVTRAGDRRELPMLSGFVLIAALFSLMDWTDNHRIETLQSDAKRLQRASDVFAEWYDSRGDRGYYESQKKPYPVFIVAASGGGLYAALHAAIVLSRLQDRCPNFSQHVFAISGVSGGSLGGALFADLATRQAKNSDHIDCFVGALPDARQQFEKQTDHFMDTDFLSPVLGSALFSDAAQWFFPAFTSRFDRARAFESTITGAWTKLYPGDDDNPWSKPFLATWNPKSAAPALVLNSTNVEHGFRVSIAPFRIIDQGELGNIVALSNLADFHELARVSGVASSTATLRDITQATAVSLSARFPWVLPAGRLTRDGGDIRLVDGGYVENSGIETVYDLLQVLHRYYSQDENLRQNRPAVKINVIAITNLQILQNAGSFGLGEALSPIRTMLSTREARAVVALSRMGGFEELCAEYPECDKRVSTSSFILDLYDFHLPLGWLLAPSTRRIVELHGGVANRAGTFLGGSNIDDDDKFARLGAYASNNDASACRVVAFLQGTNDTHCD